LHTYQNQLIQNFKALTPPKDIKVYEDFIFKPKDIQYQIGEKEKILKEQGNLILKFKFCLSRNYKKNF
jgi:hypothetical protein